MSNFPFEIHVTVGAPVDTIAFEKACVGLGVKPILLTLQRDRQNCLSDVMTSSRISGSFQDAKEETARIEEGLRVAGFKVIRHKIETSPDYPEVPSANCPELQEGRYFECHFNIRMLAHQRELLEETARFNKCHLSRNNFKDNPDGSSIVMMTLREFDDIRETFATKVKFIHRHLGNLGFEVVEDIAEYVMEDTCLQHDQAWVGSTTDPILDTDSYKLKLSPAVISHSCGLNQQEWRRVLDSLEYHFNTGDTEEEHKKNMIVHDKIIAQLGISE